MQTTRQYSMEEPKKEGKKRSIENVLSMWRWLKKTRKKQSEKKRHRNVTVLVGLGKGVRHKRVFVVDDYGMALSEVTWVPLSMSDTWTGLPLSLSLSDIDLHQNLSLITSFSSSFSFFFFTSECPTTSLPNETIVTSFFLFNTFFFLGGL